MTNHESMSPPIKVSASGIISNPWYHLPPQLIAMSGPRIPIPCIVAKSQLDLGNHGIRLYGQDDEIIFTFTDTSPAPRFKVNPIRYFLTYVSFIDWNIIGPLGSDVVESDYVVMGSMTFKLLEDDGLGVGLGVKPSRLSLG